MEPEVQEMIRDPEASCGKPAALIARGDLSAQDKLAVLESWQADLIELQKAADENMSSLGRDRGETAAKLAEVTAAIAAVRRQSEEDR